MTHMDPYEMALRSDPEYDYDILNQEYYANGGGWRKRSGVEEGKNQKELILKNNLNHLAKLAKRRRTRNKSKQQKLAIKYYPVFFK